MTMISLRTGAGRAPADPVPDQAIDRLLDGALLLVAVATLVSMVEVAAVHLGIRDPGVFVAAGTPNDPPSRR